MSIFGAFGKVDRRRLTQLATQARDAGAKGGIIKTHTVGSGDDVQEYASVGAWVSRYGLVIPEDHADKPGIVIDGSIDPTDQIVSDPVTAAQLAESLETPHDLWSFLTARSPSARYSMAAVRVEEESPTVYLVSHGLPVYYHTDQAAGLTLFSSHENDFRNLMPFGQRPGRVPVYSMLCLATGVCLGLPRIPQSEEERKAPSAVLVGPGPYSRVVSEFLRRQGKVVIESEMGRPPYSDFEYLTSLVTEAIRVDADEVALPWTREDEPEGAIALDIALDWLLAGPGIRITTPLDGVDRTKAQELLGELDSLSLDS